VTTTTPICDCEMSSEPENTGESFRDQLFEAGILIPTGVDGLYGHSAQYMSIKTALDRIVTAWATELDATSVSFPPVIARATFQKTNYLESFPDLMGSVHVFRGDERDHRQLLDRTYNGGDWQQVLEPADVVLSSASCHPLYPLCTGRLPEGGRIFEINNTCFRHEPSEDPARMQAFQMHEVVYVGRADSALRHRDRGLERGLTELRALGLDMDAVAANDPFFGRGGKLLAAGQLADALKIEGVATVASDVKPTAIMSANYHQDHFGRDFAIETAEGEVAHSACVAFGVDRITLALLRAHGLDLESWPTKVRDALWP
jgi:seryl-tRNA synthetase